MVKKIRISIGGVVIIAIVAFVLIHKYIEREHKKHVQLYEENGIAKIYPCLYSAIRDEFYDRAYHSGVQYEEWKQMMGVGCEGGYETKTIEVPDTSIQVRIRCGSLDDHIAIKQFIFKGFMPLNLHNLDSIFRREMEKNGIRLSNVYIEYIDVKKKDTVTIGEKPIKRFYATEFEPIDILKSIGVKVTAAFEMPTFGEVVKPYQWHLIILSFLFVLVLCMLTLWLIYGVRVDLSQTIRYPPKWL